MGKTALKMLMTACANLRGVIDAGWHAHVQEYLAEAERLLAENDQRGFYKHVKGTVGLAGRNVRSEQFIMDQDGTLLRGKVRIRERWGGFLQTVLNKNSPKLDPVVSALFLQRPLIPSLGDELTIDGMTGIIRGMPNWNAVGQYFCPADLLKLDHPELIG